MTSPTEGQWEAHRDEIRRLYLERRLSRSLVVTKLASKGFKVTLAQFDLRMKKWKFRQKISREAWEYVGRQIYERRAMQKESEVFISGVLVDKDKVASEVRRNTPLTIIPNPLSPRLQENMPVTIRTPSSCQGRLTWPPSLPWLKFNILFASVTQSRQVFMLNKSFSLGSLFYPSDDPLLGNNGGPVSWFHNAKTCEPTADNDEAGDRWTVTAPTIAKGDLRELIKTLLFHFSNNLNDDPFQNDYFVSWRLFKEIVRLVGPTNLPVFKSSEDLSTFAFLGKILTMAFVEDLQPLIGSAKTSRDWKLQWAGARRHFDRSTHLAILRWIFECGYPPDLSCLMPTADSSAFEDDDLEATPLQLAVLTRSQDVTDLLLDYGANVDESGEGRGSFSDHTRVWQLVASPLEIALSTLCLRRAKVDDGEGSYWLSFSKVMAALLVRRGAGRNHGRQIHELLAAVQAGNMDVVKFLVQHGASLNSQLSPRTKSGLHHNWPPIFGKHQLTCYDLAEHLTVFTAAAQFEAYEDLDEGRSTPYGSALGCSVVRFSELASENGVLELLELLHSHRGSQNGLMTDNCAWRAVDIALIAAGRGHDRVLRWLATLGADICIANSKGLSPLLVAASAGHRSTCQLLRDAGASRLDEVSLALHVAFHSLRHEIVADLATGKVDVQGCVNPRQLLSVLCKLNIILDEDAWTGEEGLVILGGPAFSVATQLAERHPEHTHPRFNLTQYAQCASALISAGAPLIGGEVTLAAEAGDLELLGLALASGANADEECRRGRQAGRTGVQIAALEGHAEVVRALLQSGAELRGDELGLVLSPNWRLVDEDWLQRKEVVEVLVEHGADLQQRTPDGAGCLELALCTRNSPLIKWMAQRLLNVYDPGALCAAVQYAVCEDDSQYVDALLKLRSYHSPADSLLETTAVSIATCSNAARPILDLLLQIVPQSDECILPHDIKYVNRPDMVILRRGPFWRSPDSLPAAPLVVSAGMNEDSAWVMLQHGYHPDDLAMSWAVQNRHQDLLLAFLSATPLISTDLKQYLPTPLLCAAENNDLAMLDIVMRHGYDVDHRPVNSVSTALQTAIFEKSWEAASFLLDHGADVNAKPGWDHGATALQYASIHGNLNLAKQLFQHLTSAEVNAHRARCGGRTAIEGAAEHGRLDMVRLLLSHGAKTEGSGQRQYLRALRWAEQGSHHAVARLLREHREWTAADQERWTSDAHLMDDEIYIADCQCGRLVSDPGGFGYHIYECDGSNCRNHYAVSECCDSDCDEAHYPSFWKVTRFLKNPEDSGDTDLESAADQIVTDDLWNSTFPAELDPAGDQGALPAWDPGKSDLGLAGDQIAPDNIGGYVFPLDLDLSGDQDAPPAWDQASCDIDEVFNSCIDWEC